MRLIDADEIKYTDMLSSKGNGSYEHVGMVTQGEIDALPTVDAIPVEIIEKRAKAYDDKAEEIEGTEFIYSYLSARVLNRLISDWRERKKE